MKKTAQLSSIHSGAIAAAFISTFITFSTAHADIRPPVSGDLVISEMMANPAAVSDTVGEWFEVLNLSNDSLILDGLLISDNGSNQHFVDSGSALLIAPQQYFVFGRNGDSSINGGYTPDYVYSNFTLSNTSDAIVLSFESSELARFEYDSAFALAGISAELTSLPALSENYQLTPDSFTYGLGDTGSPGTAGSSDLNVSSVPVPAAVWLFGSGLLGMLSLGRKK